MGKSDDVVRADQMPPTKNQNEQIGHNEKNTKTDFTVLTKDDIIFLMEYKALEESEQEELREFLQFKQYYKRRKEKTKT